MKNTKIGNLDEKLMRPDVPDIFLRGELVGEK